MHITDQVMHYGSHTISLLDISNDSLGMLCNNLYRIFIRPMLDKKTLSERDICTKYITPALTNSRMGY